MKGILKGEGGLLFGEAKTHLLTSTKLADEGTESTESPEHTGSHHATSKDDGCERVVRSSETELIGELA